MKGLAFAYDPDGYWIELVARDKEAGHPEKYNLGQTMLRVKDVSKALDFYCGQGGLGMTKASGNHGGDRREYPLTAARQPAPVFSDEGTSDVEPQSN